MAETLAREIDVGRDVWGEEVRFGPVSGVGGFGSLAMLWVLAA